MGSTVVIGGGLAGMGAAYALARAGEREITMVERGDALGGLAGTFVHDGHAYPLAYHHILRGDRTLLWFLDLLGALPRVRWRRIAMLFQQDGKLWDLRRPSHLLRFPLPVADKLRLVRLLWKSFRTPEWNDWIDRTAAELVDEFASPRVRATLFEPLTQLKFGLPCEQISAAWMGARLHHREGSDPLGFMPGSNWTQVLCEGLAKLLSESGVTVRLRTSVARLHADGDRLRAAELSDGTRLDAERFVCAVPTTVYRALAPEDRTPELDSIRYTAILSAVCATRQKIEPEFYWLNLTALETTACGLFRLDALNPTIGKPGEACLNFVTHVPGRERPIFSRSDDELWAAYRADFRRLFGFELETTWTRLSRLPIYSPVFTHRFRNPPIRSTTWRNVFFAGNYRTFPSVASTGTALHSGLEAAQAMLEEGGRSSGILERVASFELRAAPRG